MSIVVLVVSIMITIIVTGGYCGDIGDIVVVILIVVLAATVVSCYLCCGY